MSRELYSAAVATASNGSPIFAADSPTNPVTVYNEDHMLVIGDYDPVLRDYLKRDFALTFKVNSIRATGYPHVWNEQKAIPSNTTAINPRLGFSTTASGNAPTYKKSSLSTSYDRDNWSTAFCRCYATGIRYDFFTREMEKNYGTFEDLTVKDYNDMFVDFAKKTADDFWNGSTALSTNADATGWTYCGVLNQITDTSAIADNTKIADALNTKIAGMMARLDYDFYPDVIAMNPATYDLLLKEEAERSMYQRTIDAEIIPGVRVPAFYTPMGLIPIVLTPFIRPIVVSAEDADENNPAGTTHQIVALNSKMIDRIWMFNDGPKVYEFANPDMPLNNDRLLTDKAVLDFANYIVHGAQTGAHFILTKTVLAPVEDAGGGDAGGGTGGGGDAGGGSSDPGATP